MADLGGPAQEVMLSYLTGLGPVGEPVEVPLRHAMADLGYRTKVGWYTCLNKLLDRRLVRQIANGSRGSTGVFVVLRRLEEGLTVERPQRKFWNDY